MNVLHAIRRRLVWTLAGRFVRLLLAAAALLASAVVTVLGG